MHGTWQTTGGGGSGLPKELIGLALVLAAMIGVAGAVQAALAAVMVWLLIVMTVLIAAAFAVALYAVYRHKSGRPLLRTQSLVPRYQVHQLAPEPAPRQLPQHFHLHVERGTDLSALGLTFPSGIVVSPAEEEN